MRNPDRIPIILDLVRRLWEYYPDMRLGQIIDGLTPTDNDPFSIEDDILIVNLEEWIRKAEERARTISRTEMAYGRYGPTKMIGRVYDEH